jgi:hypothetical protein
MLNFIKKQINSPIYIYWAIIKQENKIKMKDWRKNTIGKIFFSIITFIIWVIMGATLDKYAIIENHAYWSFYGYCFCFVSENIKKFEKDGK